MALGIYFDSCGSLRALVTGLFFSLGIYVGFLIALGISGRKVFDP